MSSFRYVCDRAWLKRKRGVALRCTATLCAAALSLHAFVDPAFVAGARSAQSVETLRNALPSGSHGRVRHAQKRDAVVAS